MGIYCWGGCFVDSTFLSSIVQSNVVTPLLSGLIDSIRRKFVSPDDPIIANDVVRLALLTPVSDGGIETHGFAVEG